MNSNTTANPLAYLLTMLAALLFSANTASAHCQIPCGIYDDDLMVKQMLLDATTIKKCMTEIDALAGKTDPQSGNQFVRWVNNKEDHADNVIEIISNYFLTQRVKSSQDDYKERLAKHHAVMVAAMKAKQNSDAASAEALNKAILALRAYYPEHGHHH
ncbi:superoxide dismutase [Ni] [Cerasicoccus maritimus]|uniref:superoxide dismutase [Ni] n=1 Tax=Cerasicoccus maritimus TaxID=490089 RepID=UPI0028528A39|nr:superoxide dismutase [Ni] [Cerasicoccus maritimus]